MRLGEIRIGIFDTAFSKFSYLGNARCIQTHIAPGGAFEFTDGPTYPALLARQFDAPFPASSSLVPYARGMAMLLPDDPQCGNSPPIRLVSCDGSRSRMSFRQGGHHVR